MHLHLTRFKCRFLEGTGNFFESELINGLKELQVMLAGMLKLGSSYGSCLGEIIQLQQCCVDGSSNCFTGLLY